MNGSVHYYSYAFTRRLAPNSMIGFLLEVFVLCVVLISTNEIMTTSIAEVYKGMSEFVLPGKMHKIVG